GTSAVDPGPMKRLVASETRANSDRLKLPIQGWANARSCASLKGGGREGQGWARFTLPIQRQKFCAKDQFRGRPRGNEPASLPTPPPSPPPLAGRVGWGEKPGRKPCSSSRSCRRPCACPPPRDKPQANITSAHAAQIHVNRQRRQASASPLPSRSEHS